jgi:hypothetical protein
VLSYATPEADVRNSWPDQIAFLKNKKGLAEAPSHWISGLFRLQHFLLIHANGNRALQGFGIRASMKYAAAGFKSAGHFNVIGKLEAA